MVNRRVVQRHHGIPSEVAELEVAEVPHPGSAEVLVELVLAPINPAELLMFEGSYGYRETVPALPRFAGIEGVGRVVGGATDILPEGSLVSLAGMGPVFADYRVFPAAAALVLPTDAHHEIVALALVNTQAVLTMLHDSPELKRDQWIIQNASNSGYGRIVDAVATRRGYNVVNVVRSGEGAATIRSSAAGPVVLDGPDLEAAVLAATGGVRPTLALDAIGGDATNRLATVLEQGSRVVNYGLLSGEACTLDTRLTVFGGIRLEGFWMPRSMAKIGADGMAQIAHNALGYIRRGDIDVPIEARYSLDDIGRALEHASRPNRLGKIVLTR